MAAMMPMISTATSSSMMLKPLRRMTPSLRWGPRPLSLSNNPRQVLTQVTSIRPISNNEHVIADALRRFFESHPLGGSPLVVAVSGGIDSTALLIALGELGASQLIAAHVNHHLR